MRGGIGENGKKGAEFYSTGSRNTYGWRSQLLGGASLEGTLTIGKKGVRGGTRKK